MTYTIPDEFDSKFRFILVAAARAKQLQNGAPAKLSTRSRKPSFIAIRETAEGLVNYVLTKEDAESKEMRVLLGVTGCIGAYKICPYSQAPAEAELRGRSGHDSQRPGLSRPVDAGEAVGTPRFFRMRLTPVGLRSLTSPPPAEVTFCWWLQPRPIPWRSSPPELRTIC